MGETTNGKSVQFTHHASGLVKTATPQDGLLISLEYDLQGNRKKLTDPDADVVTSVYDGWGQPVRQAPKVHLTGDSIVTTYSYHASGLLQNRIHNGETTAYVYNGLNRLSSISIAGRHVQNFVYGLYDRLTQVTETVDGTKFFVSNTEYDLFGRVSKETYLGGYFITNQQV